MVGNSCSGGDRVPSGHKKWPASSLACKSREASNHIWGNRLALFHAACRGCGVVGWEPNKSLEKASQVALRRCKNPEIAGSSVIVSHSSAHLQKHGKTASAKEDFRFRLKAEIQSEDFNVRFSLIAAFRVRTTND